MIYNIKVRLCGHKSKRIARLSRGLLAFVFIFGLSAALTAEASRKKGRVDTTEKNPRNKKTSCWKTSYKTTTKNRERQLE